MNNTKTLTIIAVLMAATLVVGITFATVAATQQPAFAVPQKKPGHDDKKDNKARDSGSGNGNGNTVTIEECKNRGSASGFDTATNQECENLICTHPGENATCTQEGLAAAAAQQGNQTTPVKDPCEQCFTKFLSSEQITALLQFSNREFGINSLPDLCAQLSSGSSDDLRLFVAVFVVRALGETGEAQLIQCLQDAGIVLPPVRG